MRTRKQLLAEVKALQSRLGAAAGETRKNLRERIARLTAEKQEAEKLVKQAQADSAALRESYSKVAQELEECKQAALKHGAGAGAPKEATHG